MPNTGRLFTHKIKSGFLKKILFIASHRWDRSPSQRFRFEQYVPYFEENGFECIFAPLVTEKDDAILYGEEQYLSKFVITIKSFFKRLSDVRAASGFDIIFIQREAYLLGTSYFENRFKKSGAKIVFDFDDAIWLMDISDVNKKFSWLKRPTKTAEIISVADQIIAGNPYLADYARTYNPNVLMIPTSVDTEKFKRKDEPRVKNKICIGWTGSHTTIKHFSLALPFLKELKKKYGDKIYFKVIGDSAFTEPELGIAGLKWNNDTEIEDLSEIDIGIMPLPDDAWSRGKCGLKSLEYMSLCIPPVVSPVGVNTDIVKDDINGFVADTEEEWIDKISRLIESPDMRMQMGQKARKTVIERYSVLAHRNKYVKLFNELVTPQ